MVMVEVGAALVALPAAWLVRNRSHHATASALRQSPAGGRASSV
jgi:hypothetical protein